MPSGARLTGRSEDTLASSWGGESAAESGGVNVTDSLEYSFIIALAQPVGPALGALFADRVERKFQIIGGLIGMGIAMGMFARLAAPVALIAFGVVFTLAANVMSYAYHGYQAELYPVAI